MAKRGGDKKEPETGPKLNDHETPRESPYEIYFSFGTPF